MLPDCIGKLGPFFYFSNYFLEKKLNTDELFMDETGETRQGYSQNLLEKQPRLWMAGI